VDLTQGLESLRREVYAYMVSATQKIWTDEELLALPDDGKYELVDGELLHMSPGGGRHSVIATELLMRIHSFVKERGLGHTFDGQAGFRLSDGNLRSPDVSFVARARMLAGVPVGFLHLAPDLAVEVLSPSDRAGDVAHKVAEYLSVGVRLLWVIDPETRSAVVYRPGAPPHRPKDDVLDGVDVLPGFRCPLTALFDRATA
jgi:Uma2 family endonuclease